MSKAFKNKSLNLLYYTFTDIMNRMCLFFIQTLEQKEEGGSSDEDEGEKKKPEGDEAEGEEQYDGEEFEDVSYSILLWY